VTQKKGTFETLSGSHVQLAACGTGTLSYRQPIMDQWNGQQRAFAIKMFYKNNDSLEGFSKVPFFCVTLYKIVIH